VVRHPNLSHETFHSGSRNNFNFISNLPFSLDNKCNHLLLYVPSFMKFCARKLLQSMLVLKLIFDYKIFSTKLHAHDMFGSREFKTISQGSRDESHETFIHRLIQERILISLFPNFAIILRIHLCLICSNCSGEMSFSKLKRMKNEFRSSTSQQRLNHSSLMSIESQLLRKQNFDKLIHKFACKRARQVLLYSECLTW